MTSPSITAAHKPNPRRVVTAECTRCGGKFSMSGAVDDILPLFKAWNEQHTAPCEQGGGAS